MMKEMKMLLWKDYRLSSNCFIAGLAFIIMPYLLLFYPDVEFPGMWMFSTCLSQITMAILGGNIIASEREDRSAIFLNYQGASRKMVISSKLICCIFTFILIDAIAFIISLWISSKGFHHEFGAKPWEILGIVSAFGLYFFGSSWLISLFLRPMLAIVAGILSPYVIFYIVLILMHYVIVPFLGAVFFTLDIEAHEGLGALVLTITLIISLILLGLISLVAGTWHFIKSKES